MADRGRTERCADQVEAFNVAEATKAARLLASISRQNIGAGPTRRRRMIGGDHSLGGCDRRGEQPSTASGCASPVSEARPGVPAAPAGRSTNRRGVRNDSPGSRSNPLTTTPRPRPRRVKQRARWLATVAVVLAASTSAQRRCLTAGCFAPGSCSVYRGAVVVERLEHHCRRSAPSTADRDRLRDWSKKRRDNPCLRIVLAPAAGLATESRQISQAKAHRAAGGHGGNAIAIHRQVRQLGTADNGAQARPRAPG